MDTSTSSKKKKFYIFAMIWVLVPLQFVFFFIILSIIGGKLPPTTYSNREIISMCVESYYQEKEKIDDIAMALHNTHYNERFELGYTKSYGYTFGPHDLNDKYWDILLKINRLYPDGWSFPFDIVYTPELIMFNGFYSNDGYFAYLVMSNLAEEELKKEFPQMRIYSGRSIPEEPNCFYWIKGNWYVYFSRGRIEPKFPNYVPSLDSAVSNFNSVKDTLNYVVDVLLKANPSDTLWMHNYSSKYLPGFFDYYKRSDDENIIDERIPHYKYKQTISKYLDSFFDEEFYYYIRYFPNSQTVMYPRFYKGYSYIYRFHSEESLKRDYLDYKVYTQGDNIDNPPENMFLYKIDDHWYIQKYK